MALSRIQRAEIADDAINSAKIEDGTVLAADVIAGQITNAKISSGAGDKIASNKIAGIGTAAALNVGTGANQILQFNNTPALPAVDGSLLTNLTADNLINVLPALDGSNLTGITTDFSPITNQQARLGLHIASLESLVKYDIVDQVIDNYEDATGVTTYNGRNAHTVTAGNGGAVTSAQAKFGTNSLNFEGGYKYYSIPDSAEWAFGTGDFTFDWWWYPTNVSSYNYNHIFGNILDQNTRFMYTSSNWYMMKIQGTTLDWGASRGGSLGTLTANNWYHMAIVRSSGVVKFYLDGVADSRTFTGGNYSAEPGLNGISIGYDVSDDDIGAATGYLQEFRISNNARWTSNFNSTSFITSPSANTPDPNTKLLLHGEDLTDSSGIGKVTRVHGTSLAWS